MKKINTLGIDNSTSNFNISNCTIENSKMEDSLKIISIYVYVPFQKIYCLKVDINSTLSILNNLNGTESVYIYKGTILDIKETFSKYNITNEAIIILISPKMVNSNKSILDNWMKITKDNEDLYQKIRFKANSNNQKEFARIQDIKCIKNELKTRIFGKSQTNWQKGLLVNKPYYDSSKFNGEQNKLITKHLQQDEPSCMPLPAIW